MKTTQKGFSVVEVMLLIVVVGLVGVVGWLVFDRQNNKSDKKDPGISNQTSNTGLDSKPTTNNDATSSPTKLTTELKSHNNKFSIQLPDGWIVTNDTELDYAHAVGLENMTYAPGKPATIQNKMGFRGGGPTTTNFIIQFGDTTHLENYFSNSEYQETIKTNAGVEGKKYLYTAKEGDEMFTPGTKSYGYQFTNGSKTMVISYMKLPGDPDQLTIVEDAIRTLKLL